MSKNIYQLPYLGTMVQIYMSNEDNKITIIKWRKEIAKNNL